MLRKWGITRTEDFGELVFNLVESGKLGKTDKDSRADFANGYDFFGAFGQPFEVTPASEGSPGRSRRKTPRKRA